MERTLQERLAELERQAEALRTAAERADILREQYSDLYDYAPVGFATLDEKGTIRRLNLPAAAILGGSRQEITGARLTSFVRTADKAACSAFVKAAFGPSPPEPCELGLLRGKWRAEWIQLIAAPATVGRDLGHAGAQARVAILDVTARRKAEEALGASEHRFEAVVSAMAEGVVVHDDAGLIRACNTAAERILGMTGDEIRGKVSIDARWKVVREDGSPFPGKDHPVASVMKTGVARWNVIMGVIRQDGEVTWIRANTEPIRRADGSVDGAVVTFADVTDARRKEAELRETTARLTYVLEGANDGFWDWDIRSGVVTHSPRWSQLLGLKPSDVEPNLQSWKRRIHPDDAGTAQAALEAHLRGETPSYERRYRVRHADGTWIWILARGRVVERDAAGNPRRAAGTFTDVTAQRRADEERAEVEERMRSIVTSMAEGVVLQGADGRIVLSNAAAGRILGLTGEQLAGRTSIDPRWRAVREDGSPFPGEEHPAMVTLRTGEPTRGVVMGVHKPDGAVTWISVNAEPLRRAPGERPHAVVATFADVTALLGRGR